MYEYLCVHVQVVEFLGHPSTLSGYVLFIPYAGKDVVNYTKVRSHVMSFAIVTQYYFSLFVTRMSDTSDTVCSFVPVSRSPDACSTHTAVLQVFRAKMETEMCYEVKSLHEFSKNEKISAVEKAAAMFVGGGNTFRLLKLLWEDGVMETIRTRVANGQLKYMGDSAGETKPCMHLQ